MCRAVFFMMKNTDIVKKSRREIFPRLFLLFLRMLVLSMQQQETVCRKQVAVSAAGGKASGQESSNMPV